VSESLGDVFEFFFSNLGENDAFLRASRPIREDRVLRALEFAVGLSFDHGAPVHSMLFAVDGHDLIHGSLRLRPDIMAQVILDAASRTAACLAARLSDPHVHYMRFVVPNEDVEWEGASLVSMTSRAKSPSN